MDFLDGFITNKNLNHDGFKFEFYKRNALFRFGANSVNIQWRHKWFNNDPQSID